MFRGLVAFVSACVLSIAVLLPAPAAAQQIPPRSEYSYPDYWRANFMAGCNQGGGALEICTCILRGFEFSWPFWVAEEFDVLSQLPAAGRSTRQHELNAAATRIMLSCASNPNIYG